jgi:hypothetical protein
MPDNMILMMPQNCPSCGKPLGILGKCYVCGEQPKVVLLKLGEKAEAAEDK